MQKSLNEEFQQQEVVKPVIKRKWIGSGEDVPLKEEELNNLIIQEENAEAFN